MVLSTHRDDAMEQEQMITLAALIADRATHIEWLSGLVIICIIVLGIYVKSRTDGYARRLGEIQAATTALPDIQKQTKATTEITESIKSEFARRDWRERDRLT